MANNQPLVQIQDESTGFSETPPKVNEWKRFKRVFFARGMVYVGITILLILVICAIFAPWIAPYDPYKVGVAGAMLKPSREHLLGTDSIGRDVLSRIIYGSRTALTVGFLTVAIASVMGTFLGVLSGYFGKTVSSIIMRIVDAVMCFPMNLLALVLAAVLGGGMVNVIIAIAIAMMPGYARLANGLTLSVRENDYVVAAKLAGAKNSYIILKHIIPNIFPPLLVLITMNLGNVILSEASLSFLGIGITPPIPSWGSMVSEGYRHLLRSPHLSIAPGVAVMLTVFSFNMVGDGLRDALDPRLRGLL